MSVISQTEIQQLLSEAKLTSITEIVSFIASSVSSLCTQEIAQIEQRVTQLQKPKGMDRVMIEEVKTLVEAMLQQREQVFRREGDRRWREPNFNSIDLQEQSRRSLNEIDFTNIMNMPNPSHQLKKNATIPNISQQLAQKNQHYASEIHELRGELLSRVERRQLQELKQNLNMVAKDVVGKVTFQDAEKLMIKFQKDIFVKLNQEKGQIEQVQNKLSKIIEQERNEIQGQMNQLIKGKSGSVKLEKKLKRYLQEMAYVRSDLEKLKISVKQNFNSCGKKHKHQLEDIQLIQGVLQKITEDRGDQLESSAKPKSDEGFFLSGQLSLKGCQVVWQKQMGNSGQTYEFQSGKTSIRLSRSGFYDIACVVFGGTAKKPPMLMCNGEAIDRLQNRNGMSEGVGRWWMRQWVHIRQGKSNISLKYEGEEGTGYVLLHINFISS